MKLFNKIKKNIINVVKKNEFVRKVVRKILYFKRLIGFKILTFNIKTDDKTIVFCSFNGRAYTCSPKTIYEYMIKQKRFKDYSFIWFFKDTDKYKFLEKNKNTKVIKYGGSEFCKYISRAKYWVVNYNIQNYIFPKNDQIYIQCWHGTPLKKLGNDLIDKKNAMNSEREIHNKYDEEAHKFKFMISPSKFASEKFITAWNLDKLGMTEKIIEEGYPRNDYLYNYKKADILKIKEKLNIPKDKKVILYAPTWRDNQHRSGVGYVYNVAVDFTNLQKALGDKYVILFRSHYLISNYLNFQNYEGFVYNVSDVDDVNDLYVISDILITDYSSVFFDFANLRKPIIFYMYDFDEYKNILRDFYLDMSELPGEIVYKEDELVKAIEKTNKFKYNNKYKEFNLKFNYLDDGNAAKRVVERCIK